MKTCSFCGHTEIKNTKVQYLYKHDNHFLLVNGVPCEECEFCGEQYFAASTLKKIEKEFISIHNKKKQPKKKLSMPVEDFSDLEAA